MLLWDEGNRGQIMGLLWWQSRRPPPCPSPSPSSLDKATRPHDSLFCSWGGQQGPPLWFLGQDLGCDGDWPQVLTTGGDRSPDPQSGVVRGGGGDTQVTAEHHRDVTVIPCLGGM